MPKMTYKVQGEGTTGKALHITIPKEICLRQGIQKHTKMEFRDCDEVDKDTGKVVNVIKLYKVEPELQPNPPDYIEHRIEELRQKANEGDPVACLYLGKIGRDQGKQEEEGK